ncbi:MAG: UDP-N-acetylmuramate dehydrogenase [Actinomycetota bacterium]
MSRDAIDVAAEILRTRGHGRVTPGGPVASLTSYRIGGPAGVLFEPENPDDLRALAVAASETSVAVLVLGRGSNVLMSDRGFDGIVVRLGGGFRWSRVDGTRIHAGAAMPLPALASLAMQNDLAGLEFAVAIPASLGGAVKMNAGAHGHEMAGLVEFVDVFLLDEQRQVRLDAQDAGFAYRSSAFPPRSIVTSALLRLAGGDSAEIVARMNEAKDRRKQTQPTNLPNGGSVFKNPSGHYAARLIEEFVGKGTHVGRARVSEVHSNFIVAEDGATADEVYTLILRIQRAVHAATGIELEPELKLIGEFREVYE